MELYAIKCIDNNKKPQVSARLNDSNQIIFFGFLMLGFYDIPLLAVGLF